MLTQSKKNIAGERGDVFSAARDDLAWNGGDWPFLHGELSGSARLAGERGTGSAQSDREVCAERNPVGNAWTLPDYGGNEAGPPYSRRDMQPIAGRRCSVRRAVSMCCKTPMPTPATHLAVGRFRLVNMPRLSLRPSNPAPKRHRQIGNLPHRPGVHPIYCLWKIRTAQLGRLMDSEPFETSSA